MARRRPKAACGALSRRAAAARDAAAAAAGATSAAAQATAADEAAPPTDEPDSDDEEDDDDDAEIEAFDFEGGSDSENEEGTDDDATQEANVTFDEGVTREGYGIISGASNDKAPTPRDLKKALVAFKEEDVGWCVAMVARQVVASRGGRDQHEFLLAFEPGEHSTRVLDPSLFVKKDDDTAAASWGAWCLVEEKGK